MEFVEQHRGDSGQLWIVEQHAREHAFGDDLYAGRGAHPGVEPHSIADGLAHLLAQQMRQETRGGAGGEPPRLQQHDPALTAPFGTEQGQRHARRLAGAGGCNQHRARARLERGKQLRQRRRDG